MCIIYWQTLRTQSAGRTDKTKFISAYVIFCIKEGNKISLCGVSLPTLFLFTFTKIPQFYAISKENKASKAC